MERRPTGMRMIRGTLAVLVAGLALLVLAPTPAYACSCVAAGTEDHVRWADTILVGTVEDRDSAVLGHVFGGEDPVTYTVDVERVYLGHASSTAEIRSPEYGASCGLENVELGERYVVFAAHETIMGEPSHDLWAYLCGGTAPAEPALLERVEALAGPPAPPDPSVGRPATASLAMPAALAGGVGLTVLTGTLWLRLRRS